MITHKQKKKVKSIFEGMGGEGGGGGSCALSTLKILIL